MARIELASKKGRIVTAYNDTVIFHATKGDDTNSRPYGIVQSKYSNPFGISYDSGTREITLNPGIISIYGRQIELNEPIILDILNGALNSNKIYFIIYIELDITDFLNQRVMLLADYSNRGYTNFNNTKDQNNLYKMEAGIFKAPIRRFIFNPGAAEANNVFVDEGLACEIYDDECVSCSESIKLDGTINNIQLNNLFTFEGGKLKANSANNFSALQKYKAKTTFKNTTPGYSIASETEKIGIGDDATQIPSDLYNVYTVNRFTLCSLDNIGNGEWTKGYEYKIQASKLQKLKICFSKKSFTSHLREQYCGLFSGYKWKDSGVDTDVTCNLVDMEKWSPIQGSFDLYFWVKWHDVSFNFHEKDIMITEKSEFDACTYPENRVGSNGGDAENTYGKRIYGIIQFLFSGDTLFVTITSYGHGPTYGTSLFNAADGRLDALRNTTNRGNILIDCIYKGDVRL